MRSQAVASTLLLIFLSGIPLVAALVASTLLRLSLGAGAAVAVGGAIASGLIFFGLLGRHQYVVRGNALYVRSLGGARKIPLSHIIEVTKVKRIGRDGRTVEQVRVTHENKKGERGTASLASSDPVALLHQIVSHCPHLTEYDQGRTMRDRSVSGLLKDANE